MHLATWAALACLALSIRPLLYGITPLLPQVQPDLEASYSATALLVSVPVFCLGAASFVAPAIAARRGIAWTAMAALLVMILAGATRALLPDMGGILLASIPLGIGAGICGVLLPMIVKSAVPAGMAAAATSVYTVGMQLGGALTASIAVPLASAAGGWRPAFLVIAGMSGLAVAGWLLLGRRARRERFEQPPLATALQAATANGRGWLVATVVVFSLLVLLFQGLNSWLPALYVEYGWTDAAAGVLLAALVFAQVPGTLGAGYLADRLGQRRTYLIVPGIVLAAAIALLVVVPGGALLWALAAGVALGFIAPITLVIALDFGATSAAVGRSSAIIFGVGYIAASLSPFAIGVARDATGSFALGLGALCVLALAISASALAIPASPALQRGSNLP